MDHGWICSDGHKSGTCTRKLPGHKDAATRANTMGGNDRGKERVMAAAKA
jgi:hypothetical protein